MPQYKIDPVLKQPAYLQLYNQLREDITRGLCPYGSKLPSKRFLAAETGTSVITVQHAYDLLADEGYIESRERSGYYVSYKENELFPVAAVTEESAVDLSELTDVHEISDIPIRGPVVTPEQEQFPFNTLAKGRSQSIVRLRGIAHGAVPQQRNCLSARDDHPVSGAQPQNECHG